MRLKLKSRRVFMENMSRCSKARAEDAQKKEEQLSNEVRSLLVAGTSLSVARKRLEVTFCKIRLKTQYTRFILQH